MDNVPGGMILPHIAVERARAKRFYRQIYEGYREAIVERRLRGGQRLPSTRQLAAGLRISRLPVLNALEPLPAEGSLPPGRCGRRVIWRAASAPARSSPAPCRTISSRRGTARGRETARREPA